MTCVHSTPICRIKGKKELSLNRKYIAKRLSYEKGKWKHIWKLHCEGHHKSIVCPACEFSRMIANFIFEENISVPQDVFDDIKEDTNCALCPIDYSYLNGGNCIHPDSRYQQWQNDTSFENTHAILTKTKWFTINEYITHLKDLGIYLTFEEDK